MTKSSCGGKSGATMSKIVEVLKCAESYHYAVYSEVSTELFNCKKPPKYSRAKSFGAPKSQKISISSGFRQNRLFDLTNFCRYGVDDP